MKRLGQYLITSAIIATTIITAHAQNTQISGLEHCKYQTFTTTAYYSPLEGQVLYGKENIIKEKIMNGQGVQTASGKKPIVGYIAAPRNYAFGDHVVIPDVGVFEVQDRGGWMVPAGERGNRGDKIDLYVGAGNEGMIKAMTRGKQNIKGYHCPKGKTNINKSMLKLETKAIPQYTHFMDMLFSNIDLQEGRRDALVRTLQKYLIKLGHLEAKRHTGYFGPITTQAICDFQIKKGIVSKGSERCGVYGPKTRKAMRDTLKTKRLFPANFRHQTSIEKIVGYIDAMNRKFY